MRYAPTAPGYARAGGTPPTPAAASAALRCHQAHAYVSPHRLAGPTACGAPSGRARCARSGRAVPRWPGDLGRRSGNTPDKELGPTGVRRWDLACALSRRHKRHGTAPGHIRTTNTPGKRSRTSSAPDGHRARKRASRDSSARVKADPERQGRRGKGSVVDGRSRTRNRTPVLTLE